MSTENVKKFIEHISQDEELQERLKKLFMNNKDNLQESIVKLGEEKGYSFQTEDIEKIMMAAVANSELDDAQLESVAGGNSDQWLLMSLASIGFGCLGSLAERGLKELDRGMRGCELDL